VIPNTLFIVVEGRVHDRKNLGAYFIHMPYLPTPWANTQTQKLKAKENELIAQLKERIAAVPPSVLALSLFALGSASTIGTAFVYR